MMRSITSNKRFRRFCAVLFWLILWQIIAMAVGQGLLLASPIDTVQRWFELIITWQFWKATLFTLGHILAGFVLALAAGSLCAILSSRLPAFEDLIAPPLHVIRAIPVASFVIVALIWVPSRRLSILISFLIALPILYDAVRDGIAGVDPQLKEMAHVFRMPLKRRLPAIDLPAILPRMSSAVCEAMGLAWKSGVAAEVIGIPSGSIGERLYKAKIYLATPDLFAWTLTIVLLSMACTKMMGALLALMQKGCVRYGSRA